MLVGGTRWGNAISLFVVFLAAVLNAAEPYGLSERHPIGAFLNGKLPPAVLVQTGKWAVVDAFTNLTVDDPTMLIPEPSWPPGTAAVPGARSPEFAAGTAAVPGRLYVSTRQGQIF